MAANYGNRGRSYPDLSIDEFTARWITSFREIAADLRNYKARAVTADLKSEFDLRTIAPPYDLTDIHPIEPCYFCMSRPKVDVLAGINLPVLVRAAVQRCSALGP